MELTHSCKLCQSSSRVLALLLLHKPCLLALGIGCSLLYSAQSLTSRGALRFKDNNYDIYDARVRTRTSNARSRCHLCYRSFGALVALKPLSHLQTIRSCFAMRLVGSPWHSPFALPSRLASSAPPPKLCLLISLPFSPVDTKSIISTAFMVDSSRLHCS